MSLLGLNEITTRINSHALLENVGQRDLHNPEGVGIDLRLGSVHKIIAGEAFIEADGTENQGLRKGVTTTPIAVWNPDSSDQPFIVIEPQDYFLVQTIETVNTPHDLMPMVYPRSSLFRAGLLLLNSKTDPGYSGQLTMGLTNLSTFPVKIQLGARICNMVFYKIEGTTVKYRGQHQGGRVTPKNIERQV